MQLLDVCLRVAEWITSPTVTDALDADRPGASDVAQLVVNHVATGGRTRAAGDQSLCTGPTHEHLKTDGPTASPVHVGAATLHRVLAAVHAYMLSR